MRILTCLALVLLAAGPAAAGSVLLSEVLIDPAGSDPGRAFLELAGPAGTPLDGYVIRGRNGRGGAVTHEIALDALRIPADGVLLLADGVGGVTEVPDPDAVFAGLDFQNGPDSIELVLGGSVVDALAYGAFTGDLLAFGEGRPAPIPPPGWSLARRWAGLDTDDNLADFVLLETPTPGTAPRLPEPAAAVLLAAGLGLLALRCWRRAGG